MTFVKAPFFFFFLFFFFFFVQTCNFLEISMDMLYFIQCVVLDTNKTYISLRCVTSFFFFFIYLFIFFILQ